MCLEKTTSNEILRYSRRVLKINKRRARKMLKFKPLFFNKSFPTQRTIKLNPNLETALLLMSQDV